jgi:putative protease
MAKRMKLLAPGGSMEALRAGVLAGADTIYAGGSSFNARSYAANFDREGLRQAVDYCHSYGVEFYQTLNTLISDREAEAFWEEARYANQIGVDGLIVQDLGMVRQLRRMLPDIKISGSTQMSVCNLDGVLQAADLGLNRIVLSRELPIREIAHICEHSPIEIEVFIHGALCMCYSGQCYMSGVIGERSGNRGRCAQPCRLPYQMEGGKKGYPLSLKDLCGANRLQELAQAGVDCLKIEGRMKRKEYVTVVAGIYHQLLQTGEKPTREDMQRLETIFSRSGFTEGYLTGHRGKGMFGTRTENEDTAAFQALVKEAASQCNEKYAQRRVALEGDITIQEGQPVSLILKDQGGHTVTVTGEMPQIAQKRPTDQAMVRQQMEKLGDTPYRLEQMKATIQPGLMVPASQLNALRREGVAKLTDQRLQPPKRRVEEKEPLQQGTPWKGQPKLTVQLPGMDALDKELAQKDIARFYIPLEEIETKEESIRYWLGQGLPLWPVLPRIYFDSQQPKVMELLKAWKEAGAEGCLCGNIGQLAPAKKLGLRVMGDYSLNIYNSWSVQGLKALGAEGYTPSFELRRVQMEHLRPILPAEAIVYGRLPLMITENCVVEGSFENCGKCKKPQHLVDRTGARFLVRRAYGCRNEIWNAHPLYLGDKIEEDRQMGLAYLRLIFTDESPAHRLALVEDYLGGPSAQPETFTRGLYYKGVK